MNMIWSYTIHDEEDISLESCFLVTCFYADGSTGMYLNFHLQI